MKLTLASDLHVDIWNGKYLPEVEGNILMIAGDISNSPKTTAKTLNRLAKGFNKVFFTDGNHENYHNTEARRTQEDCKKIIKNRLTESNITYLDGSTEIYEGYKFIGINGWYSMHYLPHNQEGRQYDFNHWATYMNDYSCAFQYEYEEFRENCLLPNQLAEIQSNFIRKEVSESDIPCIVMTHTLPHEKLLHRKLHDIIWESMHGYYINNDNQRVIEDLHEKIALWQCGHTHQRYMDYFGDTLVVCNPRGYPRENPSWDWLETEIEQN